MPRQCDVVIDSKNVHIAGDAAVFDLFAQAWVPGGEQAPFMRLVGGIDLPVLWDCASTLERIPVTARAT